MHSYNQLWKSSIKANSNSINKRKVFLYVNTLFSHIFFPRKSTCQKMPNIRPSSHPDWDGRRVGEQTNKRTDRRTGEHLSIYRSMDGQTNDKTNRRTEEQTTRQRHAQTDEQTNRRVNPSVRISFPAFEPIHAYINLTRSKGDSGCIHKHAFSFRAGRSTQYLALHLGSRPIDRKEGKYTISGGILVAWDFSI